MANDEHVAILKQGVNVWNRWRKDNPNVCPNLDNAYLTGVTLIYAKLHNTYLNGAYLNGANLRYADLNGAHLIGIDLNGANLIGADLSFADLINANPNRFRSISSI